MDELSRLEGLIPDDLCRSHLASSFFFELDEIPTFSESRFYCEGSILCCRDDLQSILSLVCKDIPLARLVILRGANLGSLHEHDGCQTCGYYRKRISFDVSSLDETLELAISSQARCNRIGGFPTTIKHLLHCQQVFSVFGAPTTS